MIVRQKWTGKYPVHKSRSIPDQVVEVQGNEYYNSSNVLFNTDPVTSCTMRQQSESIVYTGGLPGHTRQGANFCVHNKYFRSYRGNTSSPFVVIQLKTNPTHTNYYHVHGSMAGAYHTSSENDAYTAFGLTTGLGVIGGSATQGYINQTYLALKPDLTKFSLPNALLDIGQLKDLIKVWNRSSSLVANLAGARLNYKFGWKPSQGDLSALLDTLLSFRQALSNFKYSGREIISSRRTILKDETHKDGNVFLDGNTHRVWHGQLTRKVHGYLVYKPLPIAVIGEWDETLRALLDTLGFELNPRIVWDKIPFSFVVDWFVNVGEWLESFKVDALELPIQILQVFLQYKERVTVESSLSWNDDVNYSFRPGISPPTVSTHELFHRVVGWPDLATFSLLKTKLPSTSQAINLVALGVLFNAPRIQTFNRALATFEGKATRAIGSRVTYYDYDAIDSNGFLPLL
jgi:hypothetical protein